MKLKTGDRLMYEGEMFTVVERLYEKHVYNLYDAEGDKHPDGPFKLAELRECPVL